MEEKDQTSLTIGDILDQLTKPSILQSPEASSLRPIIPPKLTAPPSPIPDSRTTTSIKLPSLGTTRGPESDSQQPRTTIGESSKSTFNLAIRTMSDDLVKLKQGQKPSATTIPKPIATPKPVFIPRPVPPPSSLTIPPATKQLPKISESPIFSIPPSLSKPIPPRQDFQIPSFSRPEPPRTKLPSLKELSEAPKKGEVEHFHQEKIISGKEEEEEDLLPPFLGAPVPKKKTAKPENEKVEYGLIARIISKGLTTGVLSTIIIAILAYFAIYYLVFNREAIFGPTSTPTPIATETTTPLTNELANIFGNISAINFTLPINREAAVSTLNSFIQNQTLSQNQFKRINIISQNTEIKSFDQLLDALSIYYPPELKNQLERNFMVLAYGQKEVFSKEEGSTAPKRIVFITELKNADEANQILMRWETTMPDNFKYMLGFDPNKRASPLFLDNEHEGVKIRYMNFPLPDKSLDYALTSSLTGRYYLMISNSRESIYSPADRIRGL